MNQTCTNCSAPFEVTEKHLQFLKRVAPVLGDTTCSIPPPTLCPECRQQRRQTWRNERKLYHHKCAKTGKQMVCMYSPDKPFTVYEQKEWWSDGWDGLSYGKDFDFTKTFVEQFAQLQQEVPRINLCNDSVSISCDFVNQTTHLKNCYLVFDTDVCEDVYYTHLGKNSVSCMDCLRIFDCECCYECVDCYKSYGCKWSQDLENCSDCIMCIDCIGCKHCIGCVGLRNAEYSIYNKKYTKEEYEKQLQKANLQSFAELQKNLQYARETQKKFPRKENHNLQCENSTTDYLRRAKDCTFCYDSSDIQDCHYIANVSNGAKDCCDYEVWGEGSELIYDCITVGENASRLLFSESCWGQVHDLIYCTFCMHSSYLFGCTSLKGNQYCILNKQCTKEEYEKLVPKIIDHMRETGEWGEFFPASASPFGYNETLAQDFFPLTQQEAEQKGYKWHEEDEKKDQYLGPPYDVPDTIGDTDDDICEKILRCEVAGKPYKVIPQELKFYREQNIPVPRKSPDQRHIERLQLRNPRKLWTRTCAKCSKELQTTYSPDRPEQMYCEQCYLDYAHS